MAKKQSSAFSAELLDELLAGKDPATVLTSDGLVGDLKKALAERMLNAEMDAHLDSELEQQAGNNRNDSSQKRITQHCFCNFGYPSIAFSKTT
jgi:putative transposase